MVQPYFMSDDYSPPLDPLDPNLAHSHAGSDYLRGCPRCDAEEIARMNQNTRRLIALGRRVSQIGYEQSDD